MPMPTARLIEETSRSAAIRLSVGNSTVATATLNSPCGSMYTRNALSIARGRFVRDERPKHRVDQLVEVHDAKTIVTGSISVKTRLMRGSCQSICGCRRKSMRRVRRSHQQLHERGSQDRGRV